MIRVIEADYQTLFQGLGKTIFNISVWTLGETIEIHLKS